MGPCPNHILNSFCNCPRITALSEKERKIQQMIRRGARLGGRLRPGCELLSRCRLKCKRNSVVISRHLRPLVYSASSTVALLPPSNPLKGWGWDWFCHVTLTVLKIPQPSCLSFPECLGYSAESLAFSPLVLLKEHPSTSWIIWRIIRRSCFQRHLRLVSWEFHCQQTPPVRVGKCGGISSFGSWCVVL